VPYGPGPPAEAGFQVKSSAESPTRGQKRSLGQTFNKRQNGPRVSFGHGQSRIPAMRKTGELQAQCTSLLHVSTDGKDHLRAAKAKDAARLIERPNAVGSPGI